MQTSEFELTFYKKQIAKFESQKRLNKDDLVKCQQMLQIIDNNKNYYPKQHQAMLEIDAYSRLNKLLKKHKMQPLGFFNEPMHKRPIFESKEILLDDWLKTIKNNIKLTKKSKNNQNFLQSLKDYSTWILENDNKNTAFVFLLRDMLLPYLYTKNGLRKGNVFPFLFGRKLMQYFYNNDSKDNFDYDFSDDEDLYMQFLEVIFEGATKYNDDFEKFFKFLKPKFLKIIKSNNSFYLFVKDWLKQISAKQIIVVESGRYATIPLILMCVDNRVDFKLFSTSPEFYDLYKGKIFIKNLDKMIDIEKSISQNEMFVFSSVKNGQIMIKTNSNEKVLKKCFNEINTMIFEWN